MVPKIKDIKVKDDYKLIVLFDNNQAKEYDAKMLIERHKSFHGNIQKGFLWILLNLI